jgi:hypothetical protein
MWRFFLLILRGRFVCPGSAIRAQGVHILRRDGSGGLPVMTHGRYRTYRFRKQTRPLGYCAKFITSPGVDWMEVVLEVIILSAVLQLSDIPPVDEREARFNEIIFLSQAGALQAKLQSSVHRSSNGRFRIPRSAHHDLRHRLDKWARSSICLTKLILTLKMSLPLHCNRGFSASRRTALLHSHRR